MKGVHQEVSAACACLYCDGVLARTCDVLECARKVCIGRCDAHQLPGATPMWQMCICKWTRHVVASLYAILMPRPSHADGGLQPAFQAAPLSVEGLARVCSRLWLCDPTKFALEVGMWKHRLVAVYTATDPHVLPVLEALTTLLQDAVTVARAYESFMATRLWAELEQVMRKNPAFSEART